jgi:RNA polymerase sigma factor (TIGR02999 family)
MTPLTEADDKFHLKMSYSRLDHLSLSPMEPPELVGEATRGQITDLLIESRGGNPEAMDRVFQLVYRELRRIASRQLRGERGDHTLSTTGLVHETYLKLANQSRVQWQDRAQFYRAAAGAMRRILIDYARRYLAERRGGGLRRVTLDEEATAAERGETMLAVDEALEGLAALDRRLSQVVECRYFGGLTEEETADALGITARTVRRDWAKARSWLYLELSNSQRSG